MEENVLNEENLIINEQITREFQNYGKYLKFVRNGKITYKNFNWIIIDNSYNLYKDIAEKIKEYNEYDNIETKIIIDLDYINRKGQFEKERLINDLNNKKETSRSNLFNIAERKEFSNLCNIIIIGSLNEDVAVKYLENSCTFFCNLNNLSCKNNTMINQFLAKNSFSIKDNNILERLKQIEPTEIERTLTRGFINALKNRRNVLIREDLFKDHDEEAKNILNELDSMVGLKKVKNEIKELYNYLLISKQKNSKVCTNMVFLGNPGTGKTTIAKLIGRLFSTLSETDSKLPVVFESRETLVGGYIGDAEKNTIQAINKAKGGILFIDEAYSLAGSDSSRDYGYRVLDTLVNQMDMHKYDITFIFAGYKKEMLDFLNNTNPGLKSRIPFELEFEDYSEYELYDILNIFATNKNFKISATAKKLLIEYFSRVCKSENFGNGRVARNLFERIEIKQANRIVRTGSKSINNILVEDVKNAIESMKEPKEKLIGFSTN